MSKITLDSPTFYEEKNPLILKVNRVVKRVNFATMTKIIHQKQWSLGIITSVLPKKEQNSSQPCKSVETYVLRRNSQTSRHDTYMCHLAAAYRV